jgi:hypothetical protein
MSLKSGLRVFVISMIFAVGLQSEARTESPLFVELACKTVADRLDTEIVGSLVNKGSSTIDVTVPSASFPFEVELLDRLGIDVLAKHRKPSPTYRRSENATQIIHLAPGQKKSFTLILREYLDGRGIPSVDVDQANTIRLLVAASTDNSGTFAVLRSNVLDLTAPK